MNHNILNAQTARLFLEGKREGKISTVMDFYADGYIDEETAAEKLNMTVEGFLMQYGARKRPQKEGEEDAGAPAREDIGEEDPFAG